MAFTYDLATDRGKCRLLIRDTDTVTVANQFFQDAEIDAYLDLYGGVTGLPEVIMYAAAEALDTWASNEAMVEKRVTLLDVSTDGPAVAKSLRDHAASLRARADAIVAAGGSGGDAGFDVAEMGLGPVHDDEQYWKKMVEDM